MKDSDVEVLRSIVGYIVHRLGVGSSAVSVLRVITTVYLCDWRAAITFQRQLTKIAWKQPFVAKLPELEQFMSSLPDDFKMEVNPSGQPGGPTPRFVRFVGDPSLFFRLSSEETECIEFVIRVDLHSQWPKMFRLAYSTYPMLVKPNNPVLNLPELAKKYERETFRNETLRVG